MKCGRRLELADVRVNGKSLGDVGVNGWFDWIVKDFAAAPGLSVTGAIDLAGTFGDCQEFSKVQILARQCCAGTGIDLDLGTLTKLPGDLRSQLVPRSGD